MTTRSNGSERQLQQPHSDREAETLGLLSKTDYAWEALGLAEFPIVTTAVKRPPTDTIEFNEQTTRRGKTIHRKWTMVGSSEYGLPRLYDLDLYVGIMVLAERHGYETRLIKTTIHELCTIPGLTPGGATYARIKAGARRFVHSGYSARGVFWPEGAQQPIELEEWHILAEARLLPSYQDPAIQDGLPPSYILLGQKFLGILKREVRKPIDLGLWRQLGTGLSKPLFHYLDTGLYNRDRFEIGLRRLANHIGQTTRYAPSHAIRKYRPYLERFVDLGFLHSFRFEKAKSKTDPYKVIVFPGPRARSRQKTAQGVLRYQEAPKNAPEGRTERKAGVSEHDPDVLVRHFALKQFGVEKEKIQPKERQAAKAILEYAEGDMEAARRIVDYAITDAKRTEFAMRSIRAVLTNSYPERALAALKQTRQRQAEAEKVNEERAALTKGAEAVKKQARREFATLDESKRAELLAEERRRLAPFIARKPEYWTDKRIEESALLTFTDAAVDRWLKERQRPTRAGN